MVVRVQAKYDYNSGHEDDLVFLAGQAITVTEEVDKEWFSGEYIDARGIMHQGMFPRNFVIPMTPERSQSIPGADRDMEKEKTRGKKVIEREGQQAKERITRKEPLGREVTAPIVSQVKNESAKESNPQDSQPHSMVCSGYKLM